MDHFQKNLMWITTQNIFSNGMMIYKYQGYAPILTLFKNYYYEDIRANAPFFKTELHNSALSIGYKSE